jgi:nucleoside-diphosphate-sugar epimerase
MTVSPAAKMKTSAPERSASSGTPYLGLRFSNVVEPHDYERFPGFWEDAQLRRWNLWGYVDARDVAQSCRLARSSG